MKTYYVNKQYRQAIYVGLMVALSFGLVGAYAIDELLRSNGLVSMFLKVIYIACLLCYVTLRHEWSMMWRKVHFGWYLFACAPTLLLFGCQVTPVQVPTNINFGILVLNVANVLITVIWEELFFRYVSRTVFEDDGKYRITDILCMVYIFMLPHLLNLIFQSSELVCFQLILAFSVGLLWLVLYRKTDCLLVSMIAHFTQNFAVFLSSLFSTADAVPYAGKFGVIIAYASMVIFCVGSSYVICRRNRYLM